MQQSTFGLCIPPRTARSQHVAICIERQSEEPLHHDPGWYKGESAIEVDGVLGGFGHWGFGFGARGLGYRVLLRTSASVRGVAHPNRRTIGGKSRLGLSHEVVYFSC